MQTSGVWVDGWTDVMEVNADMSGSISRVRVLRTHPRVKSGCAPSAKQKHNSSYKAVGTVITRHK